MKKLTTVIMVLSLVLGGVALAAAADVPQVSKNLELSGLQKISDQEAQLVRGMGGFQFNNPGNYFNMINCPQNQTSTTNPIQDRIHLQLRDGSCRQ